MTLKAEKPKDSRYPTELRTLTDHLRAKRLDLGLTQKELAARLGVDAMTINNWETSRTTPAVRLIHSIISFSGYIPTRNLKL